MGMEASRQSRWFERLLAELQSPKRIYLGQLTAKVCFWVPAKCEVATLWHIDLRGNLQELWRPRILSRGLDLLRTVAAW